ncbi:MAG: HD domain-containing protein [Clostridiales bacterium]|nr:HD domain-containing protein [Clostridiales bacterium]
MGLLKLQNKVKEKLTNDRFIHTIGVQSTSFCLALTYGADYNNANYAGLLHDYAKCMTDVELLRLSKEFNLEISRVEEENPYLLHSKLGAYYAKHEFNIEDEDILNAITYHTTGRPGMSLLEKIVFVADYIEPNRRDQVNPNLKRIRQLAFKDIDLAVVDILKSTLDYLGNDESKIDTLTIDTYNYYIDKIKNINRMEGNK